MPVSVSEDESGIPRSIETAVVQLVETRNLAKKVARVLASNRAVLAPIETYVLKMADKAASQASQPEVSAAPPSPPPSGLDNFSSKLRRTVARCVGKV